MNIEELERQRNAKINSVKEEIKRATLDIYKQHGIDEIEDQIDELKTNNISTCDHNLIHEDLNERFSFHYCKKCDYSSDINYPKKYFDGIKRTKLDELANSLFECDKLIILNKIKIKSMVLNHRFLEKDRELNSKRQLILNEIIRLPCNHPDRYSYSYETGSFYSDLRSKCYVCKTDRLIREASTYGY
jgi:hypothetical protein